ncbi:MAG TPA: UDP-N-acetylglucosamine--N-acetylmuramyl-(pentapeptide) pyrophosphoryl-undecaprenol N-acetylglucosamine transferase [Candidatus Paceibacterota bacterium]|nr:UDP-N-acetylglucosamine--N-acetylmuramyl-(pentapeptide) pyrophosphoryl-undecaprenol N-acetylglucosamine transferase [Candidatus Paceibacterota bacterium]
MTIAFTGGGTGGHFYPIIAVAEAIQDLVRERRLVAPKLYFLAPAPFEEQALFDNGIGFIRIPAGKMRRYFSLGNLSGTFTTLVGIIAAVFALFRIYPDVVFSKGGYGSVPTVLAARILGIPVIIHESDAKPGRANLLASKFAKKIAISFESAAHYFPPKAQSRIARTGIPIRKALTRLEPEGARQYLNLEPSVPTVLILGGSLGSQRINDAVVSALPEFVAFANVIHQTGPSLFESVEAVASVALGKDPHASRYHAFPYLSEMALQRAAAVANLVIARAGATTINEIALWGKPSIIIPIPETVSHDQRTNAYAYARTGAATVIEEENLAPHLLVAEAKRITGDAALSQQMGSAAAKFTDADAATILAEELLALALTHEA